MLRSGEGSPASADEQINEAGELIGVWSHGATKVRDLYQTREALERTMCDCCEPLRWESNRWRRKSCPSTSTVRAQGCFSITMAI